MTRKRNWPAKQTGQIYIWTRFVYLKFSSFGASLLLRWCCCRNYYYYYYHYYRAAPTARAGPDLNLNLAASVAKLAHCVLARPGQASSSSSSGPQSSGGRMLRERALNKHAQSETQTQGRPKGPTTMNLGGPSAGFIFASSSACAARLELDLLSPPGPPATRGPKLGRRTLGPRLISSPHARWPNLIEFSRRPERQLAGSAQHRARSQQT